jgi:hypothetical protein
MSRLLSLLLFIGFSAPLFAQNLSGKWVGYFRNSNGIEEKIYPYELTISNGTGQQINAVTITRFSNQSTATAIARGNYTPNARLLSIQETKFEQIHLDANLQACLMSNFLTYKKEQHTEILQGTYTSKNVTNGSDCGMGSVYLERDIMSAISFASKKVDRPKNKLTTKKKDSVKSINVTQASITNASMKTNEVNETKEVNEPKVVNQAVATSQADKGTTPTPLSNNLITIAKQQNAKVKTGISNETIPTHEHKYIPWVLISRENVLTKKIITHSKTISFDLIDNGTLDNDTITIYDNKILMLDHNMLSYNAIHFDLKFDDQHTTHEIIVIANNLGAAPPNTALLTYKDAKQSEEVAINTNFTQNAKLIIEYQPPK